MNIPAFLAYVFISAFTPGPNNIMAMTNSIKYGLLKALVFCLGVLFGCLIDMTLCAMATSFLFEYIPVIEPGMRWVGAIYIAYLAVVVYRDKGGEEKTLSTPSGFFTGIVMQLVNVKLIFYGITALTTFVLPFHQSWGALTLAVLFLSVLGFFGTVCWALFGSLFQRCHAKHRGGLNAVMALLLVYCAVGIVMQ